MQRHFEFTIWASLMHRGFDAGFDWQNRSSILLVATDVFTHRHKQCVTSDYEKDCQWWWRHGACVCVCVCVCTEHVNVRLHVRRSMFIAGVALNDGNVWHQLSWRDVVVWLLHVSHRQLRPVFTQRIFPRQLCKNIEPQSVRLLTDKTGSCVANLPSLTQSTEHEDLRRFLEQIDSNRFKLSSGYATLRPPKKSFRTSLLYLH